MLITCFATPLYMQHSVGIYNTSNSSNIIQNIYYQVLNHKNFSIYYQIERKFTVKCTLYASIIISDRIQEMNGKSINKVR